MTQRRESAPVPETAVSELQGWFAGRLPDDWFLSAPKIVYDRDEILVVGNLASPKAPEGADDSDWQSAAESSRIERFRDETRQQRIRVADEAQSRFSRKVSWGAMCGKTEHRFTSASVPLMTRLRLEERLALDTLVDGNVARSRSDALAWCVRLFAQNEVAWLDQLRDALGHVERVRTSGPDSENPVQ